MIDFIIVGLVALGCIASIRYLRRKRKNGGCGCGCSSCGSSEACREKKHLK